MARVSPLVLLATLAACTRTVAPIEPPAEPSAPSVSTRGLAPPSPESGPEAGTEAGTEPEPVTLAARVSLCAADAPSLADARARYDALEALVENLADTAPADDFNAQVADLYAHECLHVARLDEPLPPDDATSGLDAKAYWDQGLGIWMRSYLDLADHSDNTTWLRPSHRTVITAALRPDDPLAPWLCTNIEDCGTVVEGWRRRADRYYELWAPRTPSPDCGERVADGPPEDAYARWRDCRRDALPRRTALPLGGLGAIDDGWLVVHGRRGHYRYCDELAVYDLRSGSHYRFARCNHRPEIAAMVGTKSPTVQIEVGTLPPAMLREATWATASARYVQQNVITEYALGQALPPEMVVERPDEGVMGGGMGFGGSWSSDQTTLGWAWVHNADPPSVHATLTWPRNDSNPEDDHAVRLLSIAESQRVPGCAPAKLPTWLPKAVQKMPEDPHAIPRELIDALKRQAARGRCAPR